MKEIRKQVRSADLDGFVPGQFELDNAAQMNKQERIFERNPDSGVIRSRKPGDHGNEKIEEYSTKPHAIGPDGVEHNKERLMAFELGKAKEVRREVLDELWGANKVNHQGHWYVRLSDVVNIIGECDDLSK
jgi:hypothetical protein